MNLNSIWHRLWATWERISWKTLNHRLLVLHIAAMIWLELVYRLFSLKNLSADFVFSILFALTAGGLLTLISSLFSGKVNRIVSMVLICLLSIIYNIQLIYYSVFKVPFSFYSMTGAGDAAQFMDVILETILKNLTGVVLLFVPVVLLAANVFKLSFPRAKAPALCLVGLFCIASYGISIIGVGLTGDSYTSQYSLYYKTNSPQLSVGRLGLLTTMRLDVQRLLLGDGEAVETVYEMTPAETGEDSGREKEPSNSSEPNGSDKGGQETETADQQTAETVLAAATTETTAIETALENPFNTMDIDFAALAEKEKDPALKGMHNYFSSVEPTKKNAFTGMFKGCNLILLTAEGFSNYAIDPERTPTLYKMSTEGFEFKNFYNPVWEVSTSDGEYAACTGLIPKPGVWSFARSGKNYMPFVMGNQFKSLGYLTKAWHDHTYTYYKRDISHPNMGYEYQGVGNGLEIKKSWPESDLEMMEVTGPQYIGQQPFHTYYMTVSGHLQYNFGGNYMAKKNQKYVQDLPYSTPSKAYIACNLELEFAMKSLLDQLEAAGVAENTVIALSPDHYPYGLPRECIDELAGHKVEDNFELYKSRLIIWKKGMEPVSVDKACCSLDINPTLSNLFGLEYDSRLMMGRDILSDTPPMIIFSNRSWITDRARYNSVTNKVEYTDGTQKNAEYVKSMNKIVADRYNYSAKILDKDYYRKLFQGK